MDQGKRLNQILRKMYAKDLDLIEDVPVVLRRRWYPLARLKAALWMERSAAIKIALFSLALAAVAAGIYYYNFFTVNNYQVKMERAHVEAHLQRRNDLVPNLVAAVFNYMEYEKGIFIHAVNVRAALRNLEESVKESGAGINGMDVFSKFQAVAEAYPALKASDAYKTLMQELSDTETMIAEKRLSYNKVANYYNSRLKMFPGNVFSRIFSFNPEPVFESEDVAKVSPRIERIQSGQ